TVGGDRVRLGHEYHAGLEHPLERLGVNVLAEHMRAVGDHVDAMRVDWSGLNTLLAKKLARGADRFQWIAGLDLGCHFLETRQGDLVPEALDHVGRRPNTDRRADL